MHNTCKEGCKCGMVAMPEDGKHGCGAGVQSWVCGAQTSWNMHLNTCLLVFHLSSNPLQLGVPELKTCYASAISLCHTFDLWPYFLTICITSPLSTLYLTISNFAIISIFSSYFPLCDMSLIFPFLYRLSHMYISFYLISPMTPLYCYAYVSLSFEAIDSNFFAIYFLPYCASTCTFPAAYMYYYDTYNVFFI